MNALMTFTMMFLLNVIKTTGDCPRYCECKWKSGKESVLCTNANMTEIPKQLDSGTQLLDLTGNALLTIGSDEFFNASLLNLQKIFLSKCRLRFLEKSSFRKIINLVELDLSYNELHSVPSHTFEFITELRELRLNGNPIIRVLNNAFKMVPRLTKLDLSECRIGYVEIKAFQGLETSLEWLKLDKNKIMNIKPYALVTLGNLHGLELSGNPWNCSCGLRTLREWMLRQNVPYSIPPVCKHPSRLSEKNWDKLDLDEFACVPRIEAESYEKNGEEGTNVTLSCIVHGIPEPKVRWLRKNHPIANLSTSGGIDGKPKLYSVEIGRETSNLTIHSADSQDNGVYVCRAENKAGKSEANITLTVVIKPIVRIWSSRMIAAVGVVSLLFIIVVGLLTFCAWSSRKRKFDFRHTVGGREYDSDGYEMNHKKPINYNKIVDYGNHCRSNSTSKTYKITVFNNP
ncbi:leucine-rich repeat-containing protein 24 precursor, putative [Pediculus humanus corporis]|uniref:Leucine-rich repeat-containing protein 24, putative n=1 Tax=Pediculus humanus subsp. corporis TaxID=121224 RepID=E0VZF8_PEDHC|nr:leucine-rich repeat-containing protein 24 precursor, putative [Pediculus humanus corporis]EEB18764.1 leucine-rich repeat-containing protein 24 precursor, putative [Pediculus humanus corporis]